MFAGSDLESIVRDAVPLAPLTWFGIGGTARYFATPASVAQLAALVNNCHQRSYPVRFIGGGSNVLVRDGLFDGLVIRLTEPAFHRISIDGNRIIAGAGVELSHLIAISMRHGLSGFESLAGIPGTVGGAIRGNAGGRSGDIAQWVKSVEVLDMAGHLHVVEGDALGFAYRDSNLHKCAILSATFELGSDDALTLRKLYRAALSEKERTQPLGDHSGGCVFKNVRNISARLLIQRCGLLGTSVGGARVSDKHGNFITVMPNTRTEDVLILIERIRDRVHKSMNIELECEIDIW